MGGCFGLLATKGIGEGPISEIVRARNYSGVFKSLADFCTRVDPKFVGKGAIETLIKAGAMDSLAEGRGTSCSMLSSERCNLARANAWLKKEAWLASLGKWKR